MKISGKRFKNDIFSSMETESKRSMDIKCNYLKIKFRAISTYLPAIFAGTNRKSPGHKFQSNQKSKTPTLTGMKWPATVPEKERNSKSWIDSSLSQLWGPISGPRLNTHQKQSERKKPTIYFKFLTARTNTRWIRS